MADFGHEYAQISMRMKHGTRTAFIDGWGAGPFHIKVEARIHHFTDSDRFGPLLESAGGRVLDNQPAEKHPFWKAHHMWRKDGRKIEGGFCVWREPKPGQFWKDKRGLSHFLCDPEWEPLGYVRVAAPQSAPPAEGG